MLDAPRTGAVAPSHRVIPISTVSPRARSVRALDAAVRWSLVTRARARMASGYYDRARVRDRIADAVLLEMARA